MTSLASEWLPSVLNFVKIVMHFQPAFSLCTCCQPTRVILFIFGKEDPQRTRKKGMHSPGRMALEQRKSRVGGCSVSGSSEGGRGRAVSSVSCVDSEASTRGRKTHRGDQRPLSPPPPMSVPGADPWGGFWSGHHESSVDNAAVIPKPLRNMKLPPTESPSRPQTRV